MDDLTEIVDFDKIYSYQKNPYYKRIRFREESDLIHYIDAEKIIDETSKGFLEKELTKIHLNQLFSETKKALEKSTANPRDPEEYINERIDRIKQSREAGNQYSRYNAIPTGASEKKKKPMVKQIKPTKINPLLVKAKIYGKMVSNENRKKYDAQPKVYKPNISNIKRIMHLQKPKNRFTEYGHYYTIRNRLLYKEEIEEFDNEFTELLLECVLFEKDHLDVQGYLEEKLRLHQFEIPKYNRKLGTETETEIEIEKVSHRSSNNEFSSDIYGFDSNLNVVPVKKVPIKHKIAVKQKRPQKNDSFIKNYYDLIDDNEAVISPCETNNLIKNNKKVIIIKPDEIAEEIMLTDNKIARNDEKVIEEHIDDDNINRIINVKINNMNTINNTNHNIKIEEKDIMSNIDNINKNIIDELESEDVENNITEKPSQCETSKLPTNETNYHINIADIINEFNSKLKARNIEHSSNNIDNNINVNTSANPDNTVININTIDTNYIPNVAPSTADTSTTYYSTNSASANTNKNFIQQPKDLFEKIINFQSVGVHTDNIDTSKAKYLPPINEEAENNNEQSCFESLSPTQSFLSLPPPPSEMELKLLEKKFTETSKDNSSKSIMEINCDNTSQTNLNNNKSKNTLGYCEKPVVKLHNNDNVDKNFVRYVKLNKSTNDDDIAMESYAEEYEQSDNTPQSLIQKFQNILK